MGGDRSRVLVLAVGYLATIVLSAFVMDWFVVDLGVDSVHIDLNSGRGLFGSLAMSAFWGSLLLMIPAVIFQSFTRITTGIANAKLSRYGIYIGLTLLTTGLAAAYMFAPEITGIERTVAPVVFIAANVLGIAALHYAALETTDDNVGVYKPVVLDKPIEKRSPTVPPTEKRSPTLPPARSPTLPPADKRAPTTPPIPETMKKKLAFVVLSGEVTRAGIDARREDGSSLLVLWRDVVGVVARRLPDELEAATFVDIVSEKGSTLRIMPWTRLTGIPVVGAGDGRMRALAGFIATMCTDTPLFDPATKKFLETSEPAAQLKDLAKLAAHDERLS